MKGRYLHYSDEELAFIKNGSKKKRKDLHRIFCNKFKRKDVSQNNLSALCKRRGWMTGRTGCFKKGNIPSPNAGAKGPNKTSFKKGNLPTNWRPVGSTRILKDGYIEIKVKEPNQWTLKHIAVWTGKNGEIPNGHCLVFKDGDKKNCDIHNLELLSRNANLQINILSHADDSKELKPVIRTLGKLIAKNYEISQT